MGMKAQQVGELDESVEDQSWTEETGAYNRAWSTIGLQKQVTVTQRAAQGILCFPDWLEFLPEEVALGSTSTSRA